MKYKVIKDFSTAEKGDIFEEVEGLNIYECVKEENNDNTYISTALTFDSITMDELMKKGYVIELFDNEECCDDSCDKLKELEEFIDELVVLYTKNYDKIVENYNNGEVQPCVKVEAETVYHNLLKVLNTIKDKINE